MLFPLPPKPKGVLAPDFLNPAKKKDDESSSTDVSQEKRRSPRFSTKKRKLSNGKGTSEGSISWDQIKLDLDTSASVANVRLVNYRKAVEKIKSYLDSIGELQVRLYLLCRSFVYYIWSHLIYLSCISLSFHQTR